MNTENTYLIDQYDKELPPIYIYFFELIFKSIEIDVCIKIYEDYFSTPDNFGLWVPTEKRVLINPYNPPILNHCEESRQLYLENAEEIKLLFDEAKMAGALKEMAENVYEITIYDYRKALNYLNNEVYSNKWAVYGANDIPTQRKQAMGKYQKVK